MARSRSTASKVTSAAQALVDRLDELDIQFESEWTEALHSEARRSQRVGSARRSRARRRRARHHDGRVRTASLSTSTPPLRPDPETPLSPADYAPGERSSRHPDETLLETEIPRNLYSLARVLGEVAAALAGDGPVTLESDGAIRHCSSRRRAPTFEIEVEREIEDGTTETSIESEIQWDWSWTARPTPKPSPKPWTPRRSSRSRASQELRAVRGSSATRPHEHRWRLVHRNGNIIATSGEGYTTKANALKGARSVMEPAPGAEVRLEVAGYSDDLRPGRIPCGRGPRRPPPPAEGGPRRRRPGTRTRPGLQRDSVEVHAGPTSLRRGRRRARGATQRVDRERRPHHQEDVGVLGERVGFKQPPLWAR